MSLTGLVLSGGGARGAYEVGVIKFMYEKLAKELGPKMRFDVFCGTSVGAINACCLAATTTDPQAGIREIVKVWENMRFDAIMQFGLRQMLTLPRLLFSEMPALPLEKGRLGGLFNTRPLEKILIKGVPWAGIKKGLQSGAFKALAISATDVLTGLITVFVQSDGALPTWPSESFVHSQQVDIGPAHALASAAIPILFPAVMVDGRFYVDGGMRQNTPISPALRLGANKLVIIGLKHESTTQERAEMSRSGALEKFPGLPFIIGKLLNALLLDHLDSDLDRLERFNTLLKSGRLVYGEEFSDKINAALLPYRQNGYRPVQTAVIRPSVDLGRIAAYHARYGAIAKRNKSLFSRYLRHSAISSHAIDADLLSYLFFDAEYAHDLIELGFKDAQNSADALANLFLSDNEN